MGLLYLAVLVILSVNLFVGRTFDSFLRMARFGGGIGVEISVNKLDATDNIEFGQLFMITETSIIYFDSTKGKFIELPKGKVNYVSYPAEPNWALPPSNPQNQWKLFFPN